MGFFLTLIFIICEIIVNNEIVIPKFTSGGVSRAN